MDGLSPCSGGLRVARTPVRGGLLRTSPHEALPRGADATGRQIRVERATFRRDGALISSRLSTVPTAARRMNVAYTRMTIFESNIITDLHIDRDQIQGRIDFYRPGYDLLLFQFHATFVEILR